MESKKVFIGGQNNDDSPYAIDTREFLGALNLRFFSSQRGKTGEVTSVEGARAIATTLNYLDEEVAFSLPAGTNETIGAVEDEDTQRLFFFNKNSNGDDGIYMLDFQSGYIYTVLLAEDVTGWDLFSSLIHSANIVGSKLYWTDGDSNQKSINYNSGIKLYHTTWSTDAQAYSPPISYKSITTIRPQPWVPLTISKEEDVNYENNFVDEFAGKFLYRFVYRDGEESTFSPWSEIANYNTPTETDTDNLNSIVVTVPYDQYIEQDVLRVEIGVRYSPDENVFIIKDWDRDIATESDEIDDHNSQTTNLSFTFYNDKRGNAVAQTTADKAFDSVPRTSETQEVAKNRLKYANNLFGYNTPSTTSMEIAVTTVGVGVTGSWYKFVYWTDPGHTTQDEQDFIYISGIATPGYYRETTPGSYPPYPATVDFTTLTFVSASFSGVLTYLGIILTDLISSNYQADSDVTNVTPTSDLTDLMVLKTNALYQAGIVFFDFAGRKCGVVTKDALKIITPDRVYNETDFKTGFVWNLSNADAANEIPEWATHYAPVLTKCQRTRFFVDSLASGLKYITKDANGDYQEDSTYSASHFGLGVKAGYLFGSGLGYTFNDGDLMYLYVDSVGKYVLKVKDTWGEYIIVDTVNLGSLGTPPAADFEIFTPYISEGDEPFYEYGQVYEVENSVEYGRLYSTISGIFDGDVILRKETISAVDYFFETMSPNKKFWRNWNTSHGRANFITKLGEQQKPLSLCWSNTFVPGSNINGLSTFDALDETTLPEELGEVNKIILADKIESEGSTLIAIGKTRTASIYLGETVFTDTAGQNVVGASSSVISTIRELRGKYGTIHPETVFFDNGNIFWFDALAGCVVRYASNGLFAISDNKMSEYFATVAQDVINGSLNVRAGIDRFNYEHLFYIQKSTSIPQNTILYDMEISSADYEVALTPASPIYSQNLVVSVTAQRLYKVEAPEGVTVTYNGEVVDGYFIADQETTSTLVLTGATEITGTLTLTQILRSYYEPYDGQNGVWVYVNDSDKWFGRRSFIPQWIASVGNRLCTFKDGMPYIHDDDDNPNGFYGVDYDSVISSVHNEGGNNIKVYRAVSIEGDCFDIVHFRTEVPFTQSTDLRDEFVEKEGVWYAGIRRDRISPNVTASYDEALVRGEELRGELTKFQGVFLSPSSTKSFKFVNIKFENSRGHTAWG